MRDVTLDLAWNSRAVRIQNRIDALASITDETGMITRTFLSPAMQKANRIVAEWMKEAGLAPAEDRFGNLLGQSPGDPGAPVFLLGSHLDSVRNAGRYDGPLGVVLAIEAVDILRSNRVELPFSLAVAGFSDEEGVRFQNAYTGSKAFCGLLTPNELEIPDRDGVTLRELLEPGFVLSGPTLPVSGMIGYLEVHIEQGPVLEHRGIPLGVVTAIAGQSRFRLTWTGKASHAGTTPAPLRRDALCGAATFIREVEGASEKFTDLMATVGQLYVEPNVSNVVPGRVVHSLDLRHQEDSVRNEASSWLAQRADELVAARQLACAWETLQVTEAKRCDAELSRRLLNAVETVSGSACQLPSGAGHDAAILAVLFPVAMLFVRCRGGLSHHPDEFVSLEDIRAALQATVEFLSSWESI
jgi:allantoate deiminase